MIALSEFFRLVKALKLIRLNFLSYQNAGVVARKKSIALTQIQNASDREVVILDPRARGFNFE